MQLPAPLPTAPSLRAHWALAPGLHYLNHGGFGGVPRIVREAAEQIRSEVDRNPTDFLVRQLPHRLQEVRRQLAGFLRADPAGTVFVPNATAGVATVLAGMALEPGDEVVTTDHCYGAVRIALDALMLRTGARLRIADVPLDSATDQSVVDAVLGQSTARTKLLVIDHVASATGFLFPVKAIVAAAKERGIIVCVDGAHALAMLDVDLTDIGADFWVGNLHKWLCAPRASAVLVVAPQHRNGLRPLVPSHWFEQGLLPAFDWTGTHDPAALLAVPAALEFLTELGWEQVRRRQTDLAAHGADLLAVAVGTRVPVAQCFSAALRVVELPRVLTDTEARALEFRLLNEHHIEVPMMAFQGGWRLLRVSGAVYNDGDDYAVLAQALPQELAALETKGTLRP